MLLIVSLPANDAHLAGAAERAGADMLKVHLNVVHRASKTEFGGWSDEKERIAAVLEAVKIPVGIMPGAETVASQDEWGAISAAGIAFFDIYAHHMRAWMWSLPVKKMPAISELLPAHIIMNVCRGACGAHADWLEASIVRPEDYGRQLTAADLADYRFICECVDTPVVVPTQKAVTPADVPLLADCGVAALMIGKIVTGDTPESVEMAVGEFRAAIDALHK